MTIQFSEPVLPVHPETFEADGMKTKIPILGDNRPVLHSGFVPAWNDEFDMRRYYGCIHPAQYDLQDKSELNYAKLVYGIAVVDSISWITILRAGVQAEREQPNVFMPILLCLKEAAGEKRFEYSDWFQTAHPILLGASPEEWFETRGLRELTKLLTFQRHITEKDIYTDVALNTSGDMRNRSATQWMIAESAQSTLKEPPIYILVRSLFAVDDWEDEFDPAFYFADWAALRSTTQARDLEFAESLLLVHQQFIFWIGLYREVLRAGCAQAGILPAVGECIHHLLCHGPIAYPAWYNAPQPGVFTGTTPKDWFNRRNQPGLARLLRGFSSQH